MAKIIFGALFGLALLASTPALAAEIGGTASGSPMIVLAEGAIGGLPGGDILRMEPAHLMALGVGVIAGATLIGPYLGVSELIGVGVGVIAGDLIYRSSLWPFRKGWLD